MRYKYTMNPSSQGFTISSFLTFSAYIFSESISLKYHCTFCSFLTKLLILLRRVPTFIKENFLQISASDHLIYETPLITTTTINHLNLPDTTCYYYSYWSVGLSDTTCYYNSYRSPCLPSIIYYQLPTPWAFHIKSLDTLTMDKELNWLN
jgi:hypothetical protein